MILKKAFLEYLLHEHDYADVSQALYDADRSAQNDVIAESEAREYQKLYAPSTPDELDELVEEARRSGTLGMYIRQLAHRRSMLTYRAAVFEMGQISRDYWSRLLNDELNASKEKLLRVAVLLKLSREETETMLEKAGFSLSPSILRDVVVGYCLDRGIYQFEAIEELLADREVQSLFNDRRGA